MQEGGGLGGQLRRCVRGIGGEVDGWLVQLGDYHE